ncbi:MAG: PQQ-dependent sugar dehydrogenase [Akkermansiaceae bacterium]|nr:PQQ-dependent sugar dehydrogenase [Akkermansiaceae bacterium]
MKLHTTKASLGVILALGLGLGLAPAQDANNMIPQSIDKVIQPGQKKLPKPVSIQMIKIADDLIDPINVVSPKDGTGRLFVIERDGYVRIIDKEGKIQPRKKAFLNISDTTVSSFLEQGLYDLEFHPDFKTNGKFYIHYSDMWFNGDSFIVEYQVSKTNPNKADKKTVRVIMQIEQPYANHNGGELAFGPDGYLYIGSGDGGWEGDVLNAGQDVTTLLSKILRIDINTSTPDRAYGIPADNPLVTPKTLMVLFGVTEEAFAKIQPTARPEIWAYGIRNPWKMHFDSKTGDLYIADVGQNHWEEVNFQPASSKGGENYGWKFMCGTHPFPISKKNAPQVGVLPICEYTHAGEGICVTGLGVYRGTTYPSLDGTYFLSDWGSGKVWGMQHMEDGQWAMEELLDTTLMPTGSGQGEDGSIYVTTAHANYGGPVQPSDNKRGALWKIVASDKVPDGAETIPVEPKK